jgi:hypothetical protein
MTFRFLETENLVEDVPKEDADDDVVLEVEDDAFAVILGFVVDRCRRRIRIDRRFGFGFLQSFAGIGNGSSERKLYLLFFA